MAEVVVVGGGLGGLATALRLAKQRHRVTLVEQGPHPGGALLPRERDGYCWDGSATSTLLPAVVRDLFRKTGRPLERELDLVPLDTVREHRFRDGTVVRLPGGSRAAQIGAVDALGDGLGRAWADHVAAYADDWEALRKHYLEVPWEPGSLPAELRSRLDSRETLHRRLRRALPDPRLRLLAAHPFRFGGHEPRDVPAWAGVESYLEQRFGAWRVAGGTGELAAALTRRLETRRVRALTSTRVNDLVLRGGKAVAVSTEVGDIDADVVVCAVDPRRLPALRPHVERTLPVIPPPALHLGVAGDPLPDLDGELVLHGQRQEATLVLRRSGTAPEGDSAWTLHSYGRMLEEPLTALARRGPDLRDRVRARITLSPAELVGQWNGSPLGIRWQGRRTVHRRLGPRTPIPGVYAVGAHATPGAGIPYVGLSAALVAQLVGTAER